MKYVNIRQSNH